MAPLDDETDAVVRLESWLLPSVGFLSLFSEEDQAVLSRQGARGRYRKGQSVFNVGESSAMVYIVLSGGVKIYQGAANGKEIICWICGPGEVFGIAELFGEDPRAIGAQARVQSELLCIPRSAFTAFLAERPEAALMALGLLGRRMRCLSRALVVIASENITARLARLLLGLAHRGSARDLAEPAAEGTTAWLVTSFTQQELADMIGATRQTVSETLNEMRRKGLLDVAGRRICLRSLRGLSQLL